MEGKEGRKKGERKKMSKGGREKQRGLQGGSGGFGRCPGGGINGTLAVGEGDRGESMMTPGFGSGVLANAGTICPS